jgi:hypothetical protein
VGFISEDDFAAQKGYCFSLTLEPEPEIERNVDAARAELYIRHALRKWRSNPKNAWLHNVPLGKLPARDREAIKLAAHILMTEAAHG